MNKWTQQDENCPSLDWLLLLIFFHPSCFMLIRKWGEWNPFWGIIFSGQHRRGGFFFQMPWHFWLTATQPGRRANKLLVTLLCHASCVAPWSRAKIVLSRRCNMQKMDQAGRKKEAVRSELLLMGTQACEWLICASQWLDQLLLVLGRELQESVFKS